MIRLLASAVLGSLLLIALPWSAVAGPRIKVGNGTAASCTETALRNALAVAEVQGGGLISFKCGAGAVTIPVTEPLTIPDQTTIDGGNLITLQAVPPDNFFLYNTIDVGPDSTAELQRVTLRLGWQVVYNQGDLTVRHSTIAGSIIHNLTNAAGGTLTVIDSTICCEIFDVAGGGIFNLGDLTVRRTSFSDSFGGGIYNAGTATIDSSTFTNNQWPEGFGGAVWNAGGTMTITDSIFSGNSADSRGGAIEESRYPHRAPEHVHRQYRLARRRDL
jgi:hypothetical protein